MQGLWDRHQASIQFQDEMLQLLFGDMGGKRVGKRNTTNKKQSLSSLLVQLPPTWDGDLDGIQVPACWDQLNNLYTGFGMVHSQRFRMCTGSKDNAHGPEVFQPSDEDRYS